MKTIFYDKTEKGREEISSRKFGLSAKLRPLLVMVDGKHTPDELLKSIIPLGMNAEHVQALLDQNFITELIIELPDPEPEVQAHDHDATIQGEHGVEINPKRIGEVRSYLSETIKNNLGLRGFALQLKVERANTLADFLEIKESFVEAIFNTKGLQMARSFESRINQVLYGL